MILSSTIAIKFKSYLGTTSLGAPFLLKLAIGRSLNSSIRVLIISLFRTMPTL